MGALNPVRELTAGERPRDWGLGEDEPPSARQMRTQGGEPADADPIELATPELHAPARVDAEPRGELGPQHPPTEFAAPELHAPARVISEQPRSQRQRHHLAGTHLQ